MFHLLVGHRAETPVPCRSTRKITDPPTGTCGSGIITDLRDGTFLAEPVAASCPPLVDLERLGRRRSIIAHTETADGVPGAKPHFFRHRSPHLARSPPNTSRLSG